MMTDTVPSRFLLLLPDEDTRDVPAASALRLAILYFLLRDASVEIVFTSRYGGYSALAGIMRRLIDEPVVARLMGDATARDELSETVSLNRVYIDDFDALILFIDGVERASPEVGRIVSEFLDIGRPIILSEALDPIQNAVEVIQAMISIPRS